MTPLAWTVDVNDGFTLVAVRGSLRPSGIPELRTALLQCLAEQPDALLVDAAGMEFADDAAVSLFTAVALQATLWPGAPVLICAPTPQVAELIGRGRLPVYATVEDGRRAVAGGRVVAPSVSDRLLPIAGAVRQARNLATEACLAWGLPELVGSATLVMSELVANAVEHAGTTMTVQVVRRGRFVHIAVRDGSSEEPVTATLAGFTERGRGLLLVASVALHWGSLPSREGKVVWATLAA